LRGLVEIVVGGASLIYSVLEEALQSGEWFHAWWLPDDSMIGCVINYRGEGSSCVRWTYSGIEGERGPFALAAIPIPLAGVPTSIEASLRGFIL
jgi:hypothetical protein